MAQIMIDTDSESIAGLMLLSRLLTDYANMRAVQDKALADSYAKADPLKEHVHPNPQLEVYAGTGAMLDAKFGTPDTRVLGMLPELAAAFAEHGRSEPDPAAIFGKFGPVPTGTNVVPLFPAGGVLGVTPGAPATASSVPLAPTTTQTTALPATTTTAVGSAPLSATTATAPTIPGTALTAPANGVTVLSADVDSAGLPWDERIHSSSKAKKGDGTWKIKRGLEAGVAQAITAAALAAKIATPTTSVPALSTAVPQNVPIMSPVPALVSNTPVTLPPTSTSAVPVFPGASVLPGATAVPTAPASAVPVSDVSAAGAVPAAPVSPVVRFREMMGKISAALGNKAITQENVKAAHEAVGLAQLQQAVLHPDKIPDIERALGLS